MANEEDRRDVPEVIHIHEVNTYQCLGVVVTNTPLQKKAQAITMIFG